MASLTDKIIASVSGSDIVTDLMDSLSSSASSALNDAETYIANRVSSLISTDDPVGTVASSLSDSSSLFASISTTSGISGTQSAAAVGKQEVDAKLSSVSSDSASAINSPVSFTTKTQADTIAASETSQLAVSEKTLPTDTTTIEKVESSGYSIGTSDDWNAAIVSISNELALSGASANSLLNSVNLDFGSTALGTTITTTTEISSTLDTITAYGSDFASSVVSVLPTDVQDLISAGKDALSTGSISDAVNNKVMAISNSLSSLGSSIDADKLTNAMLGLGTSSSNYATITNAAGDILDGFGVSSDIASLSSLYSNVQSLLCGNVVFPEIFNYQYLKDLFDSIMSVLSAEALTDLLTQMFNCSSSSTLNFVDSRTTDILTSSLTGYVTSGAVTAYESVVDLVGVSNVADPSHDLLVLNSNMTDTATNLTAYGNISDMFSISTEDLISSEYAGQTVYSGTDVSLMSITNTSVIDASIGTEDRSLIQSAMVAYA